MSPFIYKSATQLAQLIRAREASSTEIVKAHLDRIKAHNHQINALVTIFEEEAIKEAKKCDEEADKGHFRGPLHGVPVTIKEQFWIKGKRSTINAKIHKDFIAPENAVIVDRIINSGAIILGQTNVPKFLLDYQVWGDIYPEGKNPYNMDYSPGGSTGGGAAALAAGFTSLELGGDLGGSVRVPANFCGLYGLKPTDKTVPLHGNIPVTPNSKAIIVPMAQAGPLARNLNDLQTLWKIIVGSHPGERDIPNIAWQKPTDKKLKDYKIAWIDGWPDHPVSYPISRAVHNLIAVIHDHGGNTENAGPEGNLHAESLRLWVGLLPYIIALEAPWILRRIMRRGQKSTIFKDYTTYMPELNKGYQLSGRFYGELMNMRNQVTARWGEFFREYDFLICPMGFGPAYKRTKIGSHIQYDGQDLPYGKYIWPFAACFNASGHPALNVPLGLDKDGLPLGLQIVGPYWSEPELLHFAKQIEPLTEGFFIPETFAS